MDGTMTDGRKGIAYLRDHFAPAIAADDARRAAASIDEAGRLQSSVVVEQVPV